MAKIIEPFIPKAFEEKYVALLGSEYPAFLAACKTKLPRAIRANTLKISTPRLVSLIESRGVKLRPAAALPDVFIVETPLVQLGRFPEHFNGLFVVQEVASMIPVLVLDPKQNETVLDMAAAPGMKTVQMSMHMQNTGAIVAVDMALPRLNALWFNLNRLGVYNTLVVHMDARRLSERVHFDKILLDAPCSSEGLVRKRPDALQGWHPRLVEQKARVQRELISKAFSLLNAGGTLVYSTCTLSPEENEAVVDFLLRQNSTAQLESIELKGFVLRPGLLEYQNTRFHESISKTVRVYPQDNDSEAFFIAKITKKK